MNRENFALVGILWVLGPPSLLSGQDFRIELFPAKRIETLSLSAGRGLVRICSTHRPERCLSLKPDATARCVAAGGVVRCSSAGAVEQFRSASVASVSPFRLETRATNSAGSAPGRAVALREAEIAPNGHGLLVTSTVDLENYVTGVLAGEASTLSSPAALRAMSVLARTWALHWRGRHQTQGFDFCSLTHCQVFRMPGERERRLSLAEAARTTKGEVLQYHGQLADPYFSANCGGVTEAAGDLWPDRNTSYLVSALDPYCAAGYHTAWQRTLPLQTVAVVLRDDLEAHFQGALRDLAIATRDRSGRVRTLRALGTSEVRIDASQFRYAMNRRLGWNTLKSDLYNLERREDLLTFTGRGLGHGVGLCQAGAEQMGRIGIDYQTILATYFPGTNVVRLAPQGVDPILSSENFELVFPEGQRAWVGETLQTLEAFRQQLGQRAGVLPTRVRVQTWETTEEFARATGQPGWAAASNDGRSIALQPLRTLKRKGILRATLRHELAHLVVHPRKARQVPQWYEEGLVLYLTGEQIVGVSPSNLSNRDLEESVSRPHSEFEMRQSYARALAWVRELARKRGEATLWQVLERPEADDLHWLRTAGAQTRYR